MSLDAAALVDLPTAAPYLRVTGTSDNAMIEALINRASELCENWCNRNLKQRAISAIRLRGPSWPGTRLFPRAVPIKASVAITVAIDGETQTVWRTEGDGDPAAFDVILGALDPEGLNAPDHLYRADGWDPTSSLSPYNVLLSYTGGFNPIPDQLQQACLYIVQKLFRDQQKQLAEVVAINTPIGGMTLLDSAIPRVAQVLLEPYRLRTVA
jgi:hypothetical protein